MCSGRHCRCHCTRYPCTLSTDSLSFFLRIIIKMHMPCNKPTVSFYLFLYHNSNNRILTQTITHTIAGPWHFSTCTAEYSDSSHQVSFGCNDIWILYILKNTDAHVHITYMILYFKQKTYLYTLGIGMFLINIL